MEVHDNPERLNLFEGLSEADIGRMTRDQVARMLGILEAQKKREGQRLFWRYFPDKDTTYPGGVMFHAREKYAKHLEFFRVGATFRERCFMAANRVGKTVTGAYETSCHLTGLYPDWWEGRRFDRPIRAWAAGKTNETTRDIVQGSLMGEVQPGVARKGFTGTGLVPGALIKQDSVAWKQGVADLCDTVKVKHASGGWSQLGFKSYQQGRGSFEGTAQHVIWLDEEPPLDVYGECLIRTATTKGIILLTFTPLEGMSETVMQFMPQEHKTDA